MKVKINWGTGIVIAMVLFMAFILSFVYKSIAVKKYEHHLVSENYYKDELHYQEEINKLNNAFNLDENIEIKNTKDGVLIIFPNNLDYTKITGTVYFQRPSNQKIDFKQTINLKSNGFLINDNLLVSGKWNIKVDWKYNNKEYLLKEGWFY